MKSINYLDMHDSESISNLIFNSYLQYLRISTYISLQITGCKMAEEVTVANDVKPGMYLKICFPVTEMMILLFDGKICLMKSIKLFRHAWF